MLKRKTAVLASVIVVAAAVAAVVLVLRLHTLKPRLTTIQGAVIRSDQDSHKQEPLDGVLIAAARGPLTASTQSDASGYFRITFPEVIWPGQTVNLTLTHPGYHPLNLSLTMEFRSSARRLIVAAMQPLAAQVQTVSGQAAHVVSNIRIRYTVNSQSEQNIGSAVRTFQVVNQGNVPCRRQGPCSPDGVWKANTTTFTLDAGVGNEFRDARASCIAGPCPFTRIDSHGFDHGGRIIQASATNWSDTATFLLEAEVFRTSLDANVRESYPVIYDRNVNFTLPATQEGVSIEAEIDGTPMVFPLGPDIYLDWAACNSRTNSGTKSLVYQCELKQGYRF